MSHIVDKISCVGRNSSIGRPKKASLIDHHSRNRASIRCEILLLIVRKIQVFSNIIVE